MQAEFYVQDTIGSPITFTDPKQKSHFAVKLIRTDGVEVKVKTVEKNTCCESVAQQATGRVYNKDDLIIFSTDMTFQDDLSLDVGIYNHVTNQDDTNKEVTNQDLQFARGRISPSDFTGRLDGMIPVDLRSGSDGTHVGSICIEYLLVIPWEGAPLSKEMSQLSPYCCISQKKHGYSKLFDEKGSVTMGHRGCGSTSTRDADVIENTIESFHCAHIHGALFVEFDVQLTKDLVPVVYHDYHCSIPKEGEPDDCCSDKPKVPVMDLTHAQIKSSRMDFSPGKIKHGSGCKDKDIEPVRAKYREDLFPTLAEVVQRTPKEMGLLLEVKFPMVDRESGESEMEGYFSRNTLVDGILDVIDESLDHHRHLVYCSFDAQVCVLLNRKQENHPVVFLTMGPNKKYAPYSDIRTQDLDKAVSFVLSENLLGLSVFAEPFTQNRSALRTLLQQLKENGKELFTWGEANSEQEFASFQRQIGVSGVIIDGVHQLNWINKAVKQQVKAENKADKLQQTADDNAVKLQLKADNNAEQSKDNSTKNQGVQEIPSNKPAKGQEVLNKKDVQEDDKVPKSPDKTAKIQEMQDIHQEFHLHNDRAV